MSALPYTETVAQRVASFPFWYHRIELPQGVVTPGWAPVSAESYRIPEDLTGKRVLDVGAWDGYWSVEAMKRGASEVLAIDDFSDFLGQPESVQRRAWDTFDLVREAWGFDPLHMRREEMSVYSLTPEVVGEFDVIFCFGVLYHLRHPLLALDVLRTVSRGEIYLESAICDDFSPYRGGLGCGYPGAQVVMEFYPQDQLGNNPTNWWAPNLASLGMLVMSAGWLDVEVWKLTQNPEQVPHCRGFAVGRNG